MLNNLAKHIFIFVAYIAIWLSLWTLHFDALLIETASLFFLPAGLRVTALLLAPKRYWPTLICADLASFVPLNGFFHLYEYSLKTIIFDILVSTLTYFAFVASFLRLYPKVNFHSPQQTIVFLIFLSSTSLIYGVLKTFQIGIPISELTFINTALTFAFGDLMGILIVLMTTLSIISTFLSSHRWKFDSSKSIIDMLIITLIMIGVLFIPTSIIEMSYAKIVIILTMVGITYRHGLTGATVSNYIAAVCIVLYVTILPDETVKLAEQTLFVSLCLLCLILGSTVSQNSYYAQNLKDKNRVLKSQKNQLALALDNNRRLNQRIINVQEEERQRLAKDLHDEIGQNMAAMRIEMKLLDDLQNDQGKKILSQLKTIAQGINNTTHQLMNALHPRGLSELGLIDAIKYGDVAELLQKSNIELILKVKGDVKSVSDDVALALYRIFQESASNTIKYADATTFSIELAVENETLSFALKDDGNGVYSPDDSETAGLGILGIKERVYALDGEHVMRSNAYGTEHQITLPIVKS